MSTAPITPGHTVGPFFHDALPYAHGHELVPPATPGAVRLHGRVIDGAGDPVPDALVEIRQAAPDGTPVAAEGSLHRDGTFTGWGRSATDTVGRYRFVTVEPGGVAGGAPFFSVVVFARGLLHRLFTRAYLPAAHDAFLASLEQAEADTLRCTREADGSLRFDIRLQGDETHLQTVFLEFPRSRSHR